jgi:type III secretion protein L
VSYLALFLTEDATVATERRVLPASEWRRFGEARELVAAMHQQRVVALAEQATAAQRARTDGYTRGYAEGTRRAADELAQRQLQLQARADRERDVLRRQTEASVGVLALEIVRKLAGELPAGELVARLAREAVRQLVDDEPATIVVHPAVAADVRERCEHDAGAGRPLTVTVDEDSALDPLDCRIVTRAGTTLAGLETQLRRLEAAWDEVAR